MHNSELNHTTAWQKCLQIIEAKIPTKSFQTWFVPIQPKKLENNTLTIQVPNKFFFEWLEENYLDVLKEAIHKVIGPDARLEYHVLVPAEEKDTSSDDIKNPFVIPGIRRMNIDSNLSKKYTLENFVEGSCNRLAKSAGMAIARKPGETAFNPFVVYGKVGLGKTHIAQAIGNEILAQNPKKKVLYVSCEKFTNQVINSIRNGSIEDTVNFYQMLDTLIVDDVQFLNNKIKTQEIFFHIFNQLHQNKKQIIITSDRPPKDLEGLEDRLISRFKWGLTSDLQQPDFETRMNILKAKLAEENLEMPYDVQEYICYNITSNVRELEGVMISIIAQSNLTQRTLDMDLAREVVAQFVSDSNKELNLDNLINICLDYYHIDRDLVTGKSRKRNIVIARQMIMYLAKQLTNYSFKEIGQALGRDHSTVIYSCNAMQDQIETIPAIRKDYEELRKKLEMTLQTHE